MIYMMMDASAGNYYFPIKYTTTIAEPGVSDTIRFYRWCVLTIRRTAVESFYI